ncbi:MAG: hypothetical protein EHM28_09450, partial [Spirochaetaceae bacterium]
KEYSAKAGKEIANKINAVMPQNPLLLLMFPDSYTVNINDFFRGIKNTLVKPLLFCGGLSAHNFPFLTQTHQYHNDQVLTDAAPCILISGKVKIEIGVNHGCMPIGIEKTITKAKGNTVYKIDDKSAWAFFKQYLGEEVKDISIELRAFISLGEKLPDEISKEYDNFIIRSPYSLNPDESINFASELPEGAKVQLVRRDEDKIFKGTKYMAERIKLKLKGKKPIAVLHFDCAGRGKKFFGDKVKEKGIDVIQDVLGKDIPWLGVYCFGEIAPINKMNYFHNQTVVLCVIYSDIQDR